MNINEIHNLDLFPIEHSGYETALKSFVLFTTLNNETVIAVSKEHMNISFDYLSKYDYEYETKFLDDLSFEKLYNKFLELRTDKQMSDIQQEQEEASSDEDFNVSEFLQTGADILTSEDSAPIIKFVNSLFYKAIKKKASDIHIETHEFKSEVRYRIDGVLTKHIELDKNIMALVNSSANLSSSLQ